MAPEGKATPPDPLAIAVTGSGGSGAVTAGQILLAAIAHAGYYGLMTRSAGPQIRGGESAAMLRYAARPIDCMGDSFDLLVGLDWNNITRFIDEIPLDGTSIILADTSAGETPEMLLKSGATLLDLPFKALADGIEGGRVNMVATGAAGARAGLALSALEKGASEVLARKGKDVVAQAQACIRAGYAQLADTPATGTITAPVRWNISGNEASGLGAMRGGVRFVAAYPITPASEMLEWLAPHLERAGGALLQAEDELASVNMIIGSSFGGVPSLTATSGPGLSLMLEGLGLAVASETPVVVANVMRGGPSTGIPTKSEQSDLNIALHGMHGDAPHLVLAALDIADCTFTTQWAVELAEHLQTVAIVLSDQALGQSRVITDPPPEPAQRLERRRLERVAEDTPYRRYAVTDDGISPMAIPGMAGGAYTGDGLEHNPRGTPSSLARDHREQLAKRMRKIECFDYGEDWAEIRGEGPLCMLTWGSAAGAAFEAAERLRAAGRPVRVIAMRLIMPLQADELLAAIEGADSILVVEQNHGAQFYRYLHANNVLPEYACSYARPGPLPLRPGEIVDAVGQEH